MAVLVARLQCRSRSTLVWCVQVNWARPVRKFQSIETPTSLTHENFHMKAICHSPLYPRQTLSLFEVGRNSGHRENWLWNFSDGQIPAIPHSLPSYWRGRYELKTRCGSGWMTSYAKIFPILTRVAQVKVWFPFVLNMSQSWLVWEKYLFVMYSNAYCQQYDSKISIHVLLNVFLLQVNILGWNFWYIIQNWPFNVRQEGTSVANRGKMI